MVKSDARCWFDAVTVSYRLSELARAHALRLRVERELGGHDRLLGLDGRLVAVGAALEDGVVEGVVPAPSRN